MRGIVSRALLLAFALGAASTTTTTFAAQTAAPSPSPSATAEASSPPVTLQGPSFSAERFQDPAIAARVRAEFLAWQNGEIDRSRYSAEQNARLTDAGIAKLAPQLRQLGAIRSVTLFTHGKSNRGEMVYLYVVTCDNGTSHVIFALDADDKISIFSIKPS
jgi:hypothetical protein